MAEIKLSELCNSVKNCLSHFYSGVYSIVAETMDVKVSQHSGHCFMELVEKDSQGNVMVAKMRASMWSSDAKRELTKFYHTTGFAFSSGLKVLVKAKLTYHEVHGLSLVVLAIDPTYTMGDIARKRKDIVDKLKREGIFTRNKELSLPTPIQCVAVISSATAAGWGDFSDQLLRNKYNFPFYCKLFPALMQGEKAPSSIQEALNNILASNVKFDAVVIIRGGGAESHLQDLETYSLAYAIATYPLPVFTGIGHYKDENILDLVANAALKTPTAVADYLIDARKQLLDGIDEYREYLVTLLVNRLTRTKQDLTESALRLPKVVNARLENEKNTLLHTEAKLRRGMLFFTHNQLSRINTMATMLAPTLKYRINAEREDIYRFTERLPALAKLSITQRKNELDHWSRLLKLLHPQKTLERGFAIMHDDKGNVITSVEKIVANGDVKVFVSDGAVYASIKDVHEAESPFREM